MSVGSINGSANWWQWREQTAPPGSSQYPAATTSAAADFTGSARGNGGSLTAGSSMSSLLQALSADLQAMLNQGGSGPAGSSSASASGSATLHQAGDGGHHHHHHHGGGSMPASANQPVGGADRAPQGSSPSTTQINQSASVFAADLMQALQAYGGAAGTGTGTTSVLA